MRAPYVQEWNLSIEQRVKGFTIEGRYVGNHATKQYRAFDFNQVVIFENGFLADFRRAQSNGFLAQRASGSFNPNYNPAISGSQVLTFFPQLPGGGNLTAAVNQSFLQQGAVGEMANNYQITRATLDPYFDRVAATLGVSPVPTTTPIPKRDALHAKITALLCELTAYDLMQTLYQMQQSRPRTVFRG